MQLRYQLVKYNFEQEFQNNHKLHMSSCIKSINEWHPAARTHGDVIWQSLTFNTFHLVNNAVHCMLVAYLKTFEVQSCKRILDC